MEDLNKLLNLTEIYPTQLEEMTEEFLLKLRVILYGQDVITAKVEKMKNLPAPSPQQTMKRIKRLSSLNEDNEMEDKLENAATGGKNVKQFSPKKSKRSNAELLAAAESIEDVAHTIEHPVAAPRTQLENTAACNKENEAIVIPNNIRTEESNLMPPPAAVALADDTLNKRPQRAAKLKSEKCLKEPQLKGKLRRPTNEVKVKLEHEQRPSQMHETTTSESSKHSVLTELNKNVIIKNSLSSEVSDDSVSIIPGKDPSIVSICSDLNDAPPSVDAGNKHTSKETKKSANSTDSGVREVCVKVKREKLSLENQENLTQKNSDDAVFKLPAPITSAKISTMEETSLASSILSTTGSNSTTAAAPKKGRKKRDVVHKPIKVERFSDLDNKPDPVSSRTRNGSTNKSDSNVETLLKNENKRPASVYEDAVGTPISNPKDINAIAGTDGAVNETVTLGPTADATMNLGPMPNDATFCTNPAQTTFQVAPGQTTFVMETNPNATITLNKNSGSGTSADATFDVQQVPKTGKDKQDDIVGQRSFETAKDSSMPIEDSLLTEDEQEQPTITRSTASNTTNTKAKEATKLTAVASAKAVYKMPTRTNELFNPLAQSPVKMRVEAFENAAAAATEQSKRHLRSKKENTQSATTTPVIGKLAAPALGRFLTPTQSSNLTTANSSIAKKTTTSASKAMPIAKSACASSLQRSNSTASTKTLQRENSADDFRKGLHSLAEERKRQREQKHLLAAQQREAKERERAERMAKLAKEREEKRKLKKQQEQEQKKRELEEIQRKLRQQKEEDEEAAKLKAAKEREMLIQMKQQQQQAAKQKMMPPPPKTASKYTFEMLHEDDSTDDEDKVSYKRPPPPNWSRSHVRDPFMLKQEYTPSAYIDSFFSVQPMTPDLKTIFPNIDPRHLKRNSSVLWSTPPRYSELPKY